MALEERKWSPDSNRSVLYRQVLEQSDVCDVTVQVGEWMKKFHWCVLVISPFFESLRQNSFMENQTGIIQLNVASPVDTETAVLYLYGKKPKLTEENISAILELSEFLMIPNLKSACIRHIKTIPITTDNCIKLLELSSVYEFDLPKCYEYIRNHLDDVLQKKEATHLTKESIIELFTDPHLSYVSSEIRFSYLVNWSKRHRHNEAAFQEVFNCIDLDTMDSKLFEKVLQHPLVPKGCQTTYMSSEEHRVLIFTNSLHKQELACFDINKGMWCGIQIPYNSFDDQRAYSPVTINDIRNISLPEIYMVCNNSFNCSVSIINLQPKQVSVKEVYAVEKTRKGEFSCVFTAGDIFTGVTNKTVIIGKKVKMGETAPLCRNQRSNLTARDSILRKVQKNENKEEVRSSTVFYGRLDTRKTEIYAVVTIRGTEISSCCVNTEHIAGLFSLKEKILYIYDIANCRIDSVQLELNTNSIGIYSIRAIHLVPSDKGFILYDNKQVIIVSRLYGPDLAERYVVQNIDLEYDRAWPMIKYLHCATDQTWFRLLWKDFRAKKEFSFINHEDLMEKNWKELTWTPLPLTHKFEGEQAFVVRMHRSLLQCHINCPVALKATRTGRATVEKTIDQNDDDNDLYNDSDEDSEDDYTWHWNDFRAGLYGDE